MSTDDSPPGAGAVALPGQPPQLRPGSQMAPSTSESVFRSSLFERLNVIDHRLDEIQRDQALIKRSLSSVRHIR